MLNIEAAAGLLRPSRSGTGFVPPSFHRHMGEARGQEARRREDHRTTGLGHGLRQDFSPAEADFAAPKAQTLPKYFPTIVKVKGWQFYTKVLELQY
jgi:hypothetical protein